MVQYRVGVPVRSGAEMKAGAELPTLHTLHRPPLAVMPAHRTTSVPATASMLVLASAAAAAAAGVAVSAGSSPPTLPQHSPHFEAVS